MSRNILVIDDETYVHSDPSQIPGKKFFHSTNSKDVPHANRTTPKEKLPKKFLIWQAMDENGKISKPYVTDKSLNSSIYLKECISTLLLNFIHEHHRTDEILFWPDMASSHYANNVRSFLKEKNVHFVEKSQNAPNVPEARGIETFWAQCKKKYSEVKKVPKTIRGFTRIWTRISKEVSESCGQALMKRAKRNLRRIGWKGVDG